MDCHEERDITIQGILDEMAIKEQQKFDVPRGGRNLLMNLNLRELSKFKQVKSK